MLPSSKSITNRVLMLSALADTPCTLLNVSDCDDARVMSAAMSERPERIDIGAAGTAMRFSTAFFAAQPGRHYIFGNPRMHERPISVLADALNSLGADVRYADRTGYPPLVVLGRTLTGGSVEISANVSSQYISALLMIGPIMEKGLHLRLTGGIISRPYIDMTISLMQAFGAEVTWIGDQTIYVKPGRYHHEGPFAIESDWSSASYWYEIMALSADSDARIELPGLHPKSLQGDSRVREYFEMFGIQTTFDAEGAVLTKMHRPVPETIQMDLSEQPDLAQTLVVTSAMLHRPFHFKGLQTLKIKETDRLAAMRNELLKFGIKVEVRSDSELLWDGSTTAMQFPLTIDTYDDHRMAMAFAPCAMRFPEIVINHPEVVSKSYPTFWETLRPFVRN